MANKVFDRETLLDLVVNGVPLFILLFFIGVFLALPAFGFGGLEAGLQFAIVVLSFVALAILTYVTGKAITLAERTETVYMPGQANVEGSKPLEERERALERDDEETADAEPADAEPAGELTDGADDPDVQDETSEGAADEGETESDRETAGDDDEEPESAEQESTDDDRTS